MVYGTDEDLNDEDLSDDASTLDNEDEETMENAIILDNEDEETMEEDDNNRVDHLIETLSAEEQEASDTSVQNTVRVSTEEQNRQDIMEEGNNSVDSSVEKLPAEEQEASGTTVENKDWATPEEQNSKDIMEDDDKKVDPSMEKLYAEEQEASRTIVENKDRVRVGEQNREDIMKDNNNSVDPLLEKLSAEELEASCSTVENNDRVSAEEQNSEVVMEDHNNTVDPSMKKVFAEEQEASSTTVETNARASSEEQDSEDSLEDADSHEKGWERYLNRLATRRHFTIQGTADPNLVRLELHNSFNNKTLTVEISKKASIHDLYVEAAKLINLDPRTVKISEMSVMGYLLCLPPSDISLEERSMWDGKAIFLQKDAYKLRTSDSNMDSTQNPFALLPIESVVSPVTPKMDSTGNPLALVLATSVGSYVTTADCSKLCSSSSTESKTNLSLLSPTMVSDEDETLCPMEEATKVLKGLCNLGNTCFMNSAIQCLGHAPHLHEYFTQDFEEDINMQNPLGNNGELAIAFGNLLRKLCSQPLPVAPCNFKKKIANFAPQFGGANQHDSHEFLAFLLDGLHEDLNRVKEKPYIERKDADGRPDEEVATEYWENHKARNDSVIVDVFQGQEKSTLACPVCHKVSVTFDPFMCLSLPLPLSPMRVMTITVYYSDGSYAPSYYDVPVPKDGSCGDLIERLGRACCLESNETLFLTEVFNHKIIKVLNNPLVSLSRIFDNDILVAYRFPRHQESPTKLLIYHGRESENTNHTWGGNTNWYNYWATPLLTCLPHPPRDEDEIISAVYKVMKPFLKSNIFNSQHSSEEESMEDEHHNKVSKDDLLSALDMSRLDDRSITKYNYDICYSFDHKETFRVVMKWSDRLRNFYDSQYLTQLLKVSSVRLKEEISLFECLEAFLKEEPLGHDNMWYCSTCKEQRDAIKKLDLWKLPDILCIQLKRFSCHNNKLDTVVKFPIRGLDLKEYVKSESSVENHIYDLYAIINHWGNVAGGHYTAYAKEIEGDTWYHFDDSKVNVVDDVSKIQTSEVYILFYKRVVVDVEEKIL